MKRVYFLILLITIISFAMIGYFKFSQPEKTKSKSPEFSSEKIDLPSPDYSSTTSVEESLLKRRSVRGFKDLPLNLKEVSQLLWAAQGITHQGEFRTAPSAGSLYPLEIYIVVNNVITVSKGVYKYYPNKNQLVKIKEKDIRKELSAAALGQRWIEEASVILVFSAVYERTTKKYGERGIRYVHMEVGHAAQNVYLQAVSLNLGTTVVGAFNDEDVKKILNISNEELPLYLIVVGKI
ncbi:MAG: SagB/ThcOx family dehydrogenase [Ignavibacteria bacterium]|nr:SagB/ThcOx family dehydrogenase [Ignavibacteria bacterium]